MGEIRIKSGNLFDINGEHISYSRLGITCLIVVDDKLVVQIISPGGTTRILYPNNFYNPNELYTVSAKLTGKLTGIRLLSTSPFPGGTYNTTYRAYWKAMTLNNGIYMTTFAPTETATIGFVVMGADDARNPGTVENIQLLEGSYTSETIPEYQPYFLNCPAHQVTNGEWIDIPTHHFINGRWQGELTSQSPLKFRADGEMLDWRIEGRTSENLVESFRTTVNTEQYNICLLGKLDIKPSTSYTISFIMEEGAKAYFSEYIFEFKNFTGTGQRQVFNIITKDNINKNDSTWTDEYGWILCKNMFNNENPCNFREVMILEGSYTTDTLPPYEPYGGVGDWDETEQKYKIPVTVNGTTTNLYIDHQLMDGDSIDFTTDQTEIPIATGNNTLTVDTAVQPKSVFVKFEG